MPYIKRVNRKIIKETGVAKDAGELNFLITSRIQEYLIISGISYQKFNDILGVLESIKLGINKPIYNPSLGEEITTPYILHKHLYKIVSDYAIKDNTEYDILGVLEGAKLELYRRKIALYEDIKIKENGDVYYKGD